MYINLYWSVYKNLEKELLAISEVVFINDKQLDVYSMKLADLLIRTVVEIESISKELYYINGGNKSNDEHLYFDTDCIALLETKWVLSKKVVNVSNPHFYFESIENKCLTPLYKANKRGSSGADWKKAYQSVKHNRAKELRKGNLKFFIRALAALFLLNVYYDDNVFALGKKSDVHSFDSSLGSSFFCVETHQYPGLNASGIYKKRNDFEKYTYLVQTTDETKAYAVNLVKKMDNVVISLVINKLVSEFPKEKLQQLKPDFIRQYWINHMSEILPHVNRACSTEFKQLNKLEYEAVLNKNQY
ncbi:MAG: hypothetical protein LUC91_09695 [Prevotella sp.]|nr:hypothetical protein [Prevotella sp.]